jgi:quercetin dioxygenase-like cupin family protein
MPFIKISTLPDKQIFPGYMAKFLHTDNVSVGYVTITKGSTVPRHSHVHEQLTHVLEGQLKITVNDEIHIVGAGTVAVIPSNFEHSAEALTDGRALDVFIPAREDYR